MDEVALGTEEIDFLSKSLRATKELSRRALFLLCFSFSLSFLALPSFSFASMSCPFSISVGASGAGGGVDEVTLGTAEIAFRSRSLPAMREPSTSFLVFLFC